MKRYLTLILSIISIFVSYSQETAKKGEIVANDSIARVEKRGDEAFLNIIYKSIQAKDPILMEQAAASERNYLEGFTGRTIGSVIVRTSPVANPKSNIVADRFLNSLHITTRQKVVEKDLIFKSGDLLDPDVINNSRQLILSRGYISTVNFDIIESEGDSTLVDVYVTTRDLFSLGFDVSPFRKGRRSDGKLGVRVLDTNIAGTGNTLGLSTYFNWKHGGFGGNKVEYVMPNLLGRYFGGQIVAGKGFDTYDYGAKLEKEFINPRDFAGGASYLQSKRYIEYYYRDSVIVASSRSLNLWSGASIPIGSGKNSLYVSGRYFDENFVDRPDVDKQTNPYFQNGHMGLANVGVYREQFRVSNNIYGYGVMEQIPYGYQFEFLGGYQWREFRDSWYGGARFRIGNFIPNNGYLRFDAEIGSFLNCGFKESVLVTNLYYFTNLVKFGRFHYRHFIRLNVTRGWNRLDEFKETLAFVGLAELRGLRTELYGRNRLVLGNETVIFTPWNVYDFKVALYGFSDLGLIGNYGNLFRNELYTTVGFGFRIRNENLIFPTFTLRLGFAFGGHGLINAENFKINNNERHFPLRFIPGQATPVDYK